MIMHKNVIICTCMIINNLALRSGGAVVRKRKAIKNNEKKERKMKKEREGYTRLRAGRGGEGEAGEMRGREKNELLCARLSGG